MNNHSNANDPINQHRNNSHNFDRKLVNSKTQGAHKMFLRIADGNNSFRLLSLVSELKSTKTIKFLDSIVSTRDFKSNIGYYTINLDVNRSTYSTWLNDLEEHALIRRIKSSDYSFINHLQTLNNKDPYHFKIKKPLSKESKDLHKVNYVILNPIVYNIVNPVEDRIQDLDVAYMIWQYLSKKRQLPELPAYEDIEGTWASIYK